MAPTHRRFSPVPPRSERTVHNAISVRAARGAPDD